MANKRVCDLANANSVSDSDVLLVDTGSASKKVTKKVLLSSCSPKEHSHSYNDLTDKPTLLQGEKGDKGDQGEKGDKGKDGLTTTVSVNGTNYKHSNGVITLPNYPTDSSAKVAELEGKVATLEATVADLVARLEALEAPIE